MIQPRSGKPKALNQKALFHLSYEEKRAFIIQTYALGDGSLTAEQLESEILYHWFSQ